MNVDAILQWSFVDVVQRYTCRDTLLYALSVGAGADPVDERELRYVYEREQQVLPTQAVTLCHPGPWGADPSLGIDIARVVFAHQHAQFHRPLQPQAELSGREKLLALVDKGPGKGTLMVLERRIVDTASGADLVTLQSTLMLRGNGGSGAVYGDIHAPPTMPDREPDISIEMPTLPQQALIYRLNGDMNPLHADPGRARMAGFERPILHGLCSYAIAGRALLAAFCDHDATRLRSLGARFAAPLYPAETLIVQCWREESRVLFCGLCKERGGRVLDGGVAEIAFTGRQP